MKDFKWILYLAVASVITSATTTIVAEDVNKGNSTADIRNDNETTLVDPEGDQKERATRSLTNIGKLLFGGTYVMVQLGQMPPDHPLVKYPTPIQTAASINHGKVIAAVPGLNGKKADFSYHPHVAGLPPSHDPSAPVSFSYNELQDMYEPLVHKPYAPPEPIKPPSPAVTHLPGTYYEESGTGKGTIFPMTPLKTYESSFYGKDQPYALETSEDQSSVVIPQGKPSQLQPLVQMATLLKQVQPSSTTSLTEKYPLVHLSTVVKSQSKLQPTFLQSSTGPITLPPVEIVGGKRPPGKSSYFKIPRLTDFVFSSMNGWKGPRVYQSSRQFSEEFYSPAIVKTAAQTMQPTKTIYLSPSKTLPLHYVTEAQYAPSSKYHADGQYYRPYPSPTPSKKAHDSVAYSQPDPYHESKYASSSSGDSESRYYPSPSHDDDGGSRYAENSHTPTPPYRHSERPHTYYEREDHRQDHQPHSGDHRQHENPRHHDQDHRQHHQDYHYNSPRPSSTSPPYTHGPPLNVYYSKTTTLPPKYYKQNSKHKDHSSYYQYKDSNSYKNQDYSASQAHSVQQVRYETTPGKYPPLGLESDHHKQHGDSREGDFAYYPVDTGYAVSNQRPGQVSEDKDSRYTSSPDTYNAPHEYTPVASEHTPSYATHDLAHETDRHYHVTSEVRPTVSRGNFVRPSIVAERPQEHSVRPTIVHEYPHEPPVRTDALVDYQSEDPRRPQVHIEHPEGQQLRPIEYTPGPQYQVAEIYTHAPSVGTEVPGYSSGHPPVEIEYPRPIPSIPVNVEHVQGPMHYPSQYPTHSPPHHSGYTSRPSHHHENYYQPTSPPHSTSPPKVQHFYHKSPIDSPYYSSTVTYSDSDNYESNQLKRRGGKGSSHKSHHHHHHHRSHSKSKSKSYKKSSKSKSHHYRSKGHYYPSSKSSYHRHSSKSKYSRYPSSRRRDHYSPREFYESLRKYYEDMGYYNRPNDHFSSRTLKVDEERSNKTSHSNYGKHSKVHGSSNSTRDHHNHHRFQLNGKPEVSMAKSPSVLASREALLGRPAMIVPAVSVPQQYSVSRSPVQPLSNSVPPTTSSGTQITNSALSNANSRPQNLNSGLFSKSNSMSRNPQQPASATGSQLQHIPQNNNVQLIHGQNISPIAPLSKLSPTQGAPVLNQGFLPSTSFRPPPLPPPVLPVTGAPGLHKSAPRADTIVHQDELAEMVKALDIFK